MKRPCGDNCRFCTWRGACPVFAGGCIQNIFLVCRSAVFDSACCQAVLSRSVMYRTLLLILCLFWRDDGRKFSGARCREQMEQEERGLSRQDLGMWCSWPGSGCTGKSEKLEIIVNQVKVGKRVRNIADPDDIRWLSLQYPVQLSGTPGDLEGWEESFFQGNR